MLQNFTLIRQPDGTPVECRAVAQAAMLLDSPVRVMTLPIEELASRAADLRSGAALPVGTVEYVRAAMQAAGLAEPANMSYPPALNPFLRRDVTQLRAGTVLGTWFVKPVATKTFTGFVFDTMLDPDALDADDREQYDAFMALPPDAPVWVCEPVKWLSEVRYYVLNGRIIGQGRYDPSGADDAPLPDPIVVDAALAALVAAKGHSLTCALDMGVLATGSTACVEVNDAWAIGLYGNALHPKDYLEFLITRWKQICAQSAPVDRVGLRGPSSSSGERSASC